MDETGEQFKPTAKERVQAVLETLKQPKVIVDISVGAATAFVGSQLGAGPELNLFLLLASSNIAGLVRGKMQEGYYGGNNFDGSQKIGGEWYYAGDSRTITEKFVEAIRTGEPPLP